MSVESLHPLDTRAHVPQHSGALAWAIVIAAFVLLWQFGEPFAKWAFDYPKAWQIPAARWIGDAMKWLVNDASFGLFTFTDLTRFIASVVDVPYRVALSLLSTGLLSGQGSSAQQLLPPLSWVAVIGVVALMGYYAGGRRLALVVGACFVFLAVFGQWDSAMCSPSAPMAQIQG